MGYDFRMGVASLLGKRLEGEGHIPRVCVQVWLAVVASSTVAVKQNSHDLNR